MLERLRAARPQDGERLAGIDAQANAAPWSAAAFAETLARAHGLVAEAADGRLSGFIVFAVAADECEILLVAVEPPARKQGIGRALVVAALAQARSAGASRCFLEVRSSNEAAQALYGACGFARDGCRKDYYRGGPGGAREDALLMSRALDGIQT